MAASGGGKGAGGQPPPPTGPVPNVTLEEAKQLGSLSEKACDKAAASKYKDLVKFMEAAQKPPPTGSPVSKVQQSHSEVKRLEQKLEGDLARLLRLQTEMAEATTKIRDTQEGVQGGYFIDHCDLLEHMCSSEYEVTDTDRTEFEKRKQTLRDGVQALAPDLFKQVVNAARDAKQVHAQHMARLVPKRQKANDGTAQPAGEASEDHKGGEHVHGDIAAAAESAETAAQPAEPSSKGARERAAEALAAVVTSAADAGASECEL
ncbi:unnamed protein product [Prorocentrum cordatum]|uniref:Tubulin-specific chaperone A n=1 Tax=Prorocentrum cordatum TaxID=2364126 RepID=A0ABN9SGT5_9DINO|nr:unnamed protein product [Polarella glacialis]